MNLCTGTNGTVIENCTTRGTGDDCFAIWPTVSDQGIIFEGMRVREIHVIRRCTAQLPYILAQGVAVYGGVSNLVEDCLLTDITASARNHSSARHFPTSDEEPGKSTIISAERRSSVIAS